ncbi:hypothetical protein GFS31_10410 [Leptolyngbya sp. BL0902]|uniref:DUF6930 domain-containing protein n=1 Tax=Leptolyngbya sp. BL0902 TaxID=1115757 RepID=UPI0018E83956|nr:hypothetical protein [Leptolyngbya sp. BL0902]QQE64361.1 hypothetical protein GFS31_10410 [Leptolyngbya sp. BL0902]
MTRLNRITIDRLKQLPRVASVWEGDRRPMSGLVEEDSNPWGRSGQGEHSDCILWVDSGQGAVRGITMVPSSSGYEPVVRTLIQAIESPQGSLTPARPRKIVVRDREIQFYLRGAIQGLDIEVDYAPELPLIDELFNALQQAGGMEEAELPDRYGDAMLDKAMEIWELGPWHSLNEQQVIAIELNAWDIETLYVSVLGMGGVEYGLLMYRTLDSLKQFRDRVLMGQQSPKQMQEAFLEQDCLFVNFELLEDSPPSGPFAALGWANAAPDAVDPVFGSIHPLEGLRSQLADEEGAIFLVAMEALQRFLTKHRARLEKPPYPALQGSYRIPNPEKSQGSALKVTVKTLPSVTEELLEQTESALDDNDARLPVLRDDYVPEGAIILLTQIQRSWLDLVKRDPLVAYVDNPDHPLPNQATIPAVIIQTSRPKAKTLIKNLKQAQDVQAVCFNPGSDPFSGTSFDLGLLQTGDGELHLFAEYDDGPGPDRQHLIRWEQWQKASQGCCAVVITCGITGQAKGNPGLKDIIGVFEARHRTPTDLKLPPLLLQYAAEWE